MDSDVGCAGDFQTDHAPQTLRLPLADVLQVLKAKAACVAGRSNADNPPSHNEFRMLSAQNGIMYLSSLAVAITGQ